ncbi:expressed protein [Batrachochytrium dendrobatidis JAM81]|uniref:Expressed protein n=1 Tax=Batrachochytrium dendrobatidis (strain JAM81 / FGSC 10211) TaxID=684364 RepID=F4NRR6_BATDJ|nr:uncharacterized protein BATDEDRAFT_85874 [Batrachochytrium dendrobatidis JAM81]EGF83362.1 expressed protein [Batrachochytrium dendrobatidis JAM81]|eukprot:XP_006676077.1 expressed protein [Batrachochytrium dendrobatidis JAM81]
MTIGNIRGHLASISNHHIKYISKIDCWTTQLGARVRITVSESSIDRAPNDTTLFGRRSLLKSVQINRAEERLENAILEEKADSILAGLKSLYDGASANLTGLQREKEKLLEEKNILIRSYSSSDEETREISPVSDGSLKQQEIDSTIEKTKKYLFRTERWGCVTIIKKRTAITFAHNEHRTLEVGNIIKTFSIEKDSQYDLKVRKVNIESDWVLLEADVDLCEEGPIWEPVVYGRRYVQLGLSAPHQEDSPFAISTGVIHSQRPNILATLLGRWE